MWRLLAIGITLIEVLSMNNGIQTSFTDWESGLQHHGVSGMKWGVRKYQNPDGSLTPLGQKHYGTNSIYESAGKLGRRYNRLDQVRANAAGERNLQAQRAFKYGKKFTERGDKLAEKGKNPLADRKVNRYRNKAMKAVQKGMFYQKEGEDAAKLQKRVLDKAIKSGYSVNARNVKRYAQTGKQLVAQAMFGVPGQVGYMLKNRKHLSVNGSFAKISSKGPQTISIQKRGENRTSLSGEQRSYVERNAGISRNTQKNRNRRRRQSVNRSVATYFG